jgi:adenylosuccinate lyase
VIERELARYLPFLATTKVLTAAVRAGVGREAALEAIKQHATAVALAMRERGEGGNDLLDRLASDSRLGLDRAQLDRALAEPLQFVGAARAQTLAFVREAQSLLARHPDAKTYRPDPLL